MLYFACCASLMSKASVHEYMYMQSGTISLLKWFTLYLPAGHSAIKGHVFAFSQPKRGSELAVYIIFPLSFDYIFPHHLPIPSPPTNLLI